MTLLEALKEWTHWIGKMILMFWAVIFVTSQTPIMRDDTDPSDWGKRSSLSPRTDSLTGCQYLATSGGGLTPRLTADGKHMGCGGWSK